MITLGWARPGHNKAAPNWKHFFWTRGRANCWVRQNASLSARLIRARRLSMARLPGSDHLPRPAKPGD